MKKDRLALVSTDAEALFSEYFRTLEPAIREKLRGRYQPDSVASSFDRFIVDLKDGINESFAEYSKPAKEWSQCGRVHFDYIDSEKTIYAGAFCHGGRAFIGITVPFMVHLWNRSQKVAQTAAPEFAQSLNIPIDPNNFAYVIFLSMLFFVAAHEFTHHVHGHLDDLRALISREMFSSNQRGSIEIQAQEIDADSYAVFQVLQNLIKGVARPLALPLLNLESLPEHIQDNVLFSCFALSVTGYFLDRTPMPIDPIGVYTLEHPPQAIRIENLADEAKRWASKSCPSLADWISADQFNVLVGVAVAALSRMDDYGGWVAQEKFFKSEHGQAYRNGLAKARANQLAVLAKLSEADSSSSE